MKFLAYWMTCLLLCVMGMLERVACEIQGHEYSILFWVLIGLAGFFWLCSYGDIIEGKTKPPTDKGEDANNPF
jgi:hypothetical protein